ncbi:hypothetical protein FXO37_12662 [Capsicum annuum]|nr:hypothetical protein FXO37_12662 [Capsicum annuum]
MANSATKHFQVNKDRVVNSFTAWRAGTSFQEVEDRCMKIHDPLLDLVEGQLLEFLILEFGQKVQVLSSRHANSSKVPDFNSSSCNRKLIGDRFFHIGHMMVSKASKLIYFVEEYVSPRDSQGHGTHTTSTTGAPISMASVLRNRVGETRGIALGAHIVIYKVCWSSGYYSSDIFTIMDVAIKDGVDILSLSLGGFPISLYQKTISIARFRPMERRILVICAVGNNGQMQSSLANESHCVTINFLIKYVKYVFLYYLTILPSS